MRSAWHHLTRSAGSNKGVALLCALLPAAYAGGALALAYEYPPPPLNPLAALILKQFLTSLCESLVGFCVVLSLLGVVGVLLQWPGVAAASGWARARGSGPRRWRRPWPTSPRGRRSARSSSPAAIP